MYAGWCVARALTAERRRGDTRTRQVQVAQLDTGVRQSSYERRCAIFPSVLPCSISALTSAPARSAACLNQAGRATQQQPTQNSQPHETAVRPQEQHHQRRSNRHPQAVQPPGCTSTQMRGMTGGPHVINAIQVDTPFYGDGSARVMDRAAVPLRAHCRGVHQAAL